MRHLHAAPTQRPLRRWVWAGVSLGLTLGLVTQAPAHWLTQALSQASGQRMLLQDPQGSVWQGSAQWLLNEGPHNTGTPTRALPTRVHWRIAPRLDWQQWRLTLGISIASSCCTTEPIRIELSPAWLGLRTQVSDHTSHWPANWLVGLGAPWNTVQPEGRLQLQTHQLQWLHQAGVTHMQGQAELQLQQLGTRLSTLRPLGNYRVRIQGGTPIALSLDTLEGSLQLQGKGQLANGRVQFDGEASAAPDAEAALSNLLNILGQRQGTKSILKMG